MVTRVVLADQAETRFYEVEAIGGALRSVGQMSDPKAHLPVTVASAKARLPA